MSVGGGSAAEANKHRASVRDERQSQTSMALDRRAVGKLFSHVAAAAAAHKHIHTTHRPP
jgi:hypothetical protein